MKITILNQLKEVNDLLRNYPDYVYSRNPKIIENEIPVFLFHTINPEIFENQLQYLVTNGYTTLSINAFVSIIKAKEKLKAKSVLLTIDDARTSFWKYGFPLLKKYNLKATVFIIPGLTIENKVRFNLENIWNRNISKNQLKEIDEFDANICNWSEIREMYFSGLIDIESHSLFHRDVFISKEIKGFVNEKSSFRPFNSSIQPYLTFNDIGKEIKPNNYIGLPLFETDSLMNVPNHFVLTKDGIDFCKELASASNTSVNYSKRKELIEKEINKNDNFIKFIENPSKELSEDLMKSRDLIHQKLNEKAGYHLCLPWTLGNSKTIEIAKELKFESCFWGVLNKKNNKPGDDPYYMTRIKGDFIWRLPGVGRKKLFEIYMYKLSRRLNKEPVY